VPWLRVLADTTLSTRNASQTAKIAASQNHR